MRELNVPSISETGSDLSYGISETEAVEIEKRFTYHAPTPSQPPRYGRIRAMARALSETIYLNCPRSRETSVALTKLDEVVMWANAAIARNE